MNSEPALILAGIGAILEAAIVLAITFGAPITPDQKGALNAFITLLVTVATGIAIRSQVTPTARVASTIAESPHVTTLPPAV